MELYLFSPICLNLTLNTCAVENLDALRIVDVEFSEKKKRVEWLTPVYFNFNHVSFQACRESVDSISPQTI
jgi:hypothetical protein